MRYYTRKMIEKMTTEDLYELGYTVIEVVSNVIRYTNLKSTMISEIEENNYILDGLTEDMYIPEGEERFILSYDHPETGIQYLNPPLDSMGIIKEIWYQLFVDYLTEQVHKKNPVLKFSYAYDKFNNRKGIIIQNSDMVLNTYEQTVRFAKRKSERGKVSYLLDMRMTTNIEEWVLDKPDLIKD